MNIDEFSQLDLQDQISHINDLLNNISSNKSSSLARNGRNNKEKHMNFESYEYDKIKNKFIKTSHNNYPTTVNKKNIHRDKNNKNLEYRVSSLENEIINIKYQINNNNEFNIINSSVKTYESNTLVPRTYKVNLEVQQQFKTFCKENSNYKVSDLITNALIEYMDKFK